MVQPIFFSTQDIPRHTRSCMYTWIEKTMVKLLEFFNTGHIQGQSSCMSRPIEKTMIKPLLFPIQSTTHKRSCQQKPNYKTIIKPLFFPKQGIPRQKRSCMHRAIEKTMIKLHFSKMRLTQTQKVLHAQTDQDNNDKALFSFTMGLPRNKRSCMHRLIKITMIKQT